MLYFLDTNICIYALKGRYASIETRLRGLSPDVVKIASIVRAELLLGAAKSQRPKPTRQAIEEILSPFEVVPFGAHEADLYAAIRADLERRGRPIGPNDLLLAATVLGTGGTVVTRNVREFRRVKGLMVEDWTRSAR